MAKSSRCVVLREKGPELGTGSVASFPAPHPQCHQALTELRRRARPGGLGEGGGEELDQKGMLWSIPSPVSPLLGRTRFLRAEVRLREGSQDKVAIQ